MRKSFQSNHKVNSFQEIMSKNRGVFRIVVAALFLSLAACAKMEFKEGESSGSSTNGTANSADAAGGAGSITPVGGDGTGTTTPGGGTGGGTNTGSGTPVGGGGVTPVGGDGQCVPAVADILRPTKIIFLIDTTGSNAYASDILDTTGQKIGVAPATDPTKSFRYNSVSNFIKQYSMKTNFKWGILSFSKTATNTGAMALLNSGSMSNPLLGTSAQALTAVENFRQSSIDEGNTHYTPAMAMAAKAITTDADFSNPQSQYFVILVSDGMPNDPSPNVYTSNRISELTGLAPGRIKVSVVFYTSLSSTSTLPEHQKILGDTRLYLKDIVRRAEGIYGEVTGTSPGISNFNFNDVIPGTPGDPNCPPKMQ